MKCNYNFCKRAEGKKDYDLDYCCNECEKECPTVSNIFYGKILKLPIIKQLYRFHNGIKFRRMIARENREYISDTETIHQKLIWGIKSWDDLSDCDVNLHTMNDADLIYLKDKNKYILSVETIYYFEDKESEYKYLKGILDKFTEFMVKSGLYTDYELSMWDIFSADGINTEFESIEKCYGVFKFLVDGYCK